MTPFLSVVIPAYNEEKRLGRSLQAVMQYLAQQDYSYEVLVVDDGSADCTPSIVEEAIKQYSHLSLLRAQHGGKGHACREGIMAARGEWLFICDCDLSMPIVDLAKFVPLMRDDQQVVIASREVRGARRFGEPFYRHLMGRVFNLVVQVGAVGGIEDTQCGFKSFRADVGRDIFSVQRINGWGFDVEVLFVARKRGYRITEVGIDWYYAANSKIHPMQDTINMVREVWQVRANDRQGFYEKNRPLAVHAMVHPGPSTK